MVTAAYCVVALTVVVALALEAARNGQAWCTPRWWISGFEFGSGSGSVGFFGIDFVGFGGGCALQIKPSTPPQVV